MTTDITERKQVEETLKESEEKYRKIFNNEIDAICIFDIETKKILDVNQRVSQVVWIYPRRSVTTYDR